MTNTLWNEGNNFVQIIYLRMDCHNSRANIHTRHAHSELYTGHSSHRDQGNKDRWVWLVLVWALLWKQDNGGWALRTRAWCWLVEKVMEVWKLIHLNSVEIAFSAAVKHIIDHTNDCEFDKSRLNNDRKNNITAKSYYGPSNALWLSKKKKLQKLSKHILQKKSMCKMYKVLNNTKPRLNPMYRNITTI